MSSANKAKGSRNETQLEDYLNAAGVKARRLPRSGAKDIGDVAITLRSGRVIVIECKNVRQRDIAGWLREADVEKQHYSDKYQVDTYGVVQEKARGKGPGDSRITLTVDELVSLLHWENLS